MAESAIPLSPSFTGRGPVAQATVHSSVRGEGEGRRLPRHINPNDVMGQERPFPTKRAPSCGTAAPW